MAKWLPEGWHSVTPRLVVHDAAKLVEFLKQAFAATGDFRADAHGIPACARSGCRVAGRTKSHALRRSPRDGQGPVRQHLANRNARWASIEPTN
jgi:hypothetical protein